MTLKNLLLSLRRRWAIVLGGLLVTAALACGAFLVTGPTYQRNATVLLLPGSTNIPEGGNPYLYLGGLDQATGILVFALNADDVLGPILSDHPNEEVSIARDATTSGPLITISVAGPSEADVALVVNQVLESIPDTLGNLQSQADVAKTALISYIPLTADQTSTTSHKSRIELVGVVGAGGLVATLLLAGLVDGLALSRARKRAATLAEPEPHAAPDKEPEHEPEQKTEYEPEHETEHEPEQEPEPEHQNAPELEPALSVTSTEKAAGTRHVRNTKAPLAKPVGSSG